MYLCSVLDILDVRQNNKFFNLDERNYKKCSVA